MRARGWAALFGVVCVATAARAQGPPGVDLILPAQEVLGTLGPQLTAHGVLRDPDLQELVRSGFNARLHYRVELWPQRGLFRSRVGAPAEWDVVVSFDPLKALYRVTRVTGESEVGVPLGTFADLALAEAAIDAPYRVPIVPPAGRDALYYSAVLQIEVMNVSDLDELTRWLHGELSPAVRGKRNPGTALVRGIQTMVVRLLGGKTIRFEGRTPAFRV